MPQPLSNGDIVEFSIHGTHEGQRVLNVFHYEIELGIGAFPDLVTAADAFLGELFGTDKFADRYQEVTSQDLAINEFVLQKIWPLRMARIVKPQTGLTGLVEETALPPNDSVVLIKRNDSTGRHNRGRIHMPAVPVSFVEGGMVTGTARALYDLFGARAAEVIEITSGGGPVTFTPVLYQRLMPGNSAQWTSALTQGTSRVVRRRTVGVGI